MSKQIMQQALDALKMLKLTQCMEVHWAIAALEAELAKPEQVLHQYKYESYGLCEKCKTISRENHKCIVKLNPIYTWDEVKEQMDSKQPDHGFDRTASHMAGEYVGTAEPEQEPVGWFAKDWQGVYVELMPEAEDAIPLYTAPPKREWQGLASEELVKIVVDYAGYPTKQLAAIEAKLREKNT